MATVPLMNSARLAIHRLPLRENIQNGRMKIDDFGILPPLGPTKSCFSRKLYKPMINFHCTLVEGYLCESPHFHTMAGRLGLAAQGSHSSRNGIITADLMKRCDKSVPDSSQEESFQSIFIMNTLYSTVYDNLR